MESFQISKHFDKQLDIDYAVHYTKKPNIVAFFTPLPTLNPYIFETDIQILDFNSGSFRRWRRKGANPKIV